MTSENSDWVCPSCLRQDHRSCEGTLETGEIIDFCECDACKRRFERNVMRTLSTPPGGRP